MDKKAVKARQKALVEAYTKSRFEGNNTPEETISILEDAIGHREAILAVAELVNTVGDWDGRVSDRVRLWASGIDGVAGHEELDAMGAYQPSKIHPSHIDNLANYCMRSDEKRNLSYVHAPVCVV